MMARYSCSARALRSACWLLFAGPTELAHAVASPEQTTATVTFSVTADGSILNGETGDVIQKSARDDIKWTQEMLENGAPGPPMEDGAHSNSAPASTDASGGSEGAGLWKRLSDYMSGKRKKKKSTFLEPFPYVMKFFFFWWCAILLSTTMVIVADYSWLWYVRKSGSKLSWLAEIRLPVRLPPAERNHDTTTAAADSSDTDSKKAGNAARRKAAVDAYRLALWRELTDVPQWDDETHPTLKYASVLGEKQKLEKVDQVVHLCSKIPDLSETERKESIMSRRVEGICEGERFVLQTIKDAGDGGSFSTVQKTRLEIELSSEVVSSSADDTTRNTSQTTKPDARCGETNENQQQVDPHADIIGCVRIVVAGKGETMTRILAWWFNLAKQQEIALHEYFEELQHCVDAKQTAT